MEPGDHDQRRHHGCRIFQGKLSVARVVGIVTILAGVILFADIPTSGQASNVHLIFAVFALNRVAEQLGPIAGATLPALIPLTTLGLGYVALGQKASPEHKIATVAIGIGVAMTLMRPGSLLK